MHVSIPVVSPLLERFITSKGTADMHPMPFPDVLMILMLVAYSLDVVDPGVGLMSQSKPFFDSSSTVPPHGLPLAWLREKPFDGNEQVCQGLPMDKYASLIVYNHVAHASNVECYDRHCARRSL
jgi:hypothetical protein